MRPFIRSRFRDGKPHRLYNMFKRNGTEASIRTMPIDGPLCSTNFSNVSLEATVYDAIRCVAIFLIFNL
jgi:hypothetical protein